MKRTFIAFVVVTALAIGLCFADLTDWNTLSGENQEKFKSACTGAAQAISDGTPNDAQAELAKDFLSGNKPPYDQIWKLTRSTDNSLLGGSAAHTDIPIDSMTAAQIQALLGGPFDTLAKSKYRALWP